MVLPLVIKILSYQLPFSTNDRCPLLTSPQPLLSEFRPNSVRTVLVGSHLGNFKMSIS